MTRLIQIIIAGLLLILLGCDNSTNSSTTSTKKMVEGVVSYQGDLIAEGTVEVKDVNDRSVARATINNDAKYRVEIPKNSSYPLLLQVAGQKELLEAVIIDSNAVRQDISSLSTLVVKSARDLGGLTKANMAKAAIHAIQQSKKSSGKRTSTGFKGDPTKQYGGWH